MLAKAQSLESAMRTNVEEPEASAAHLSRFESMWQIAEDQRHDENVTC
jgi:hypothetical protein